MYENGATSLLLDSKFGLMRRQSFQEPGVRDQINLLMRTLFTYFATAKSVFCTLKMPYWLITR